MSANKIVCTHLLLPIFPFGLARCLAHLTPIITAKVEIPSKSAIISPRSSCLSKFTTTKDVHGAVYFIVYFSFFEITANCPADTVTFPTESRQNEPPPSAQNAKNSSGVMAMIDHTATGASARNDGIGKHFGDGIFSVAMAVEKKIDFHLVLRSS